jgi:hypothetical protein
MSRAVIVRAGPSGFYAAAEAMSAFAAAEAMAAS